MKTSELVFVGIKGSVVALNRATGQQEWAARLKGRDFVNVLLEEDVLLASCDGEVFCLDALNGKGLWHNPLKGYGTGLASLATEQNPRGERSGVMAAERHHREEQAAAAAAASSATVA
jgi:outer membrane protein assembly factor BamB